MEKTLKIEGMSCPHCAARVEKSLNRLDGIHATVNLETKTASLTMEIAVDDAILKNAVEDAGFIVID